MHQENPVTKDKPSALNIGNRHVINLLLTGYDLTSVAAAYLLALFLRFDAVFSHIPHRYLNAWSRFLPVYLIICFIVFHMFRLYRSIWQFASFTELLRVLQACAITCTVHTAAILLFYERMPISYLIIGPVFQFLFLIGIRFSYRFILLLKHARESKSDAFQRLKETDGIQEQEGIHKSLHGNKRVMIVGAGKAGQMIIRDMARAKEVNDRVICLIDDDPGKKGRDIDGVPVLGCRDDIPGLAKKLDIDSIYVAVPSAGRETIKEILNICKETGCELKNLPGYAQLVNGEVSVSDMKPVKIEDLLGRDPIAVDMTDIFNFLSGKTILVTGGGGSIGSELCRQIADHGPKQLVIFDIYENNAYEIQQELKRKHPELDLHVLIGSVRDSRRVEQLFSTYKPDIVYHAAAHKHVPLMEDSPAEAIKNNCIGTYKTAYAAMMHGCQRFVLISTDKAVNPTNIMGASKRLCEMIIQSFDRMIKEHREKELPKLYTHMEDEQENVIPFIIPGQDGSGHRTAQTEFVAVRFGNVLGSNGSVIPLFKKQIAEGGPVTVTHPEIIRYFMTIPEAVSLVLQAGTYAKGGEIFVLDMGEPVKIDTLARNLIKLSGYRPDIDIKVKYTGLRPGEKLYEEKLMAEEGLKTTPNHRIHIGMPIPFDTDHFLERLEPLMQSAYSNDPEIREKVKELVTTYHPDDSVPEKQSQGTITQLPQKEVSDEAEQIGA